MHAPSRAIDSEVVNVMDHVFGLYMKILKGIHR
jgi:hypothetical protein